MKIILILVSIALLTGFNKSNIYESDRIFITTFSKEELVEINSLIDHVDKLVIKETDNEDINTAYHLYFEKLKTNMDDGHYIIPFNSKDKFSFLEHIIENTFDEFWRVDTRNYDTTKYYAPCNEFLSINPNGKYVDYINEIGKSDSIFFDLNENILSMGDISRTGLIRFLANNSSIDFNLIKNRLLAVVCIFSIAEPTERIPDRLE